MISSSMSRREPMPASASTLWSFGASSSGSSTRFCCGAVAATPQHRRAHAAQSCCCRRRRPATWTSERNHDHPDCAAAAAAAPMLWSFAAFAALLPLRRLRAPDASRLAFMRAGLASRGLRS